MSTTVEEPNALSALRLTDLKPYFSVTVLECTVDDATGAFGILADFLRSSANDRGQALAVRLLDEIVADQRSSQVIDEVGSLAQLEIDQLYGITRERTHRPGWAIKGSSFSDLTNELTLALRRGRLVAVRTDQERALLNWVERDASPFRKLPRNTVAATFGGDGKALWMKGTHRRRVTKPDSKMLIGQRLQEVMHPLEDGTYAMSAMKVNFAADDVRLLVGDLTVSPERSHLALKAMPNCSAFFAATVEALVMLDKALTSEKPPDQPFPELAIPEPELANVFDAFDIRVAEPEEINAEPGHTEIDLERGDLLRSALLDVHGDPGSPKFTVDVGFGGSLAGRLAIKPIPVRDGYELDVRLAEPPLADSIVREIRDAIGCGDLLNVYYQSGHAFTGRQIARQNLAYTPFPNLTFADFTGFAVTREKPRAAGDQAIHDAIDRDGDDSLFAWVVQHFHTGWLICDDGAGEVADFLHLADDGTLTAIHVKAAHSNSANRGIAVTSFEEVASQVAKSAKLLHNDGLVARLSRPRIQRPACWYDGHRIADRTEFIEHLRIRVAADLTQVIIVQPHLLRDVCLRARAHTGDPSADASRLRLLDTLLHTTRRTIQGQWDDLTIIGCI